MFTIFILVVLLVLFPILRRRSKKLEKVNLKPADKSKKKTDEDEDQYNYNNNYNKNKNNSGPGWSTATPEKLLVASWIDLGFFFFFLLITSFTKIPAGNVGVVDSFGNISNNEINPGINLVLPWVDIRRFSIKTVEVKETMDVPSKEGLSMHLEISVLLHLLPHRAPALYKTVGPDYIDVVLIPNLRSVVRGVTATYDAKALYTSEREILERTIYEKIEEIMKVRGVEIESTPLRAIMLPPGLASSIEDKLKMEQESQRMEFVLTKEKQEAERKRIEAQGISDFQTIVSKGISEPLLQWKGIEATEKLANSPNTKIVIVGGKNGLPLILNQ